MVTLDRGELLDAIQEYGSAMMGLGVQAHSARATRDIYLAATSTAFQRILDLLSQENQNDNEKEN